MSKPLKTKSKLPKTAGEVAKNNVSSSRKKNDAVIPEINKLPQTR